jgi:hypothetical protein
LQQSVTLGQTVERGKTLHLPELFIWSMVFHFQAVVVPVLPVMVRVRLAAQRCRHFRLSLGFPVISFLEEAVAAGVRVVVVPVRLWARVAQAAAREAQGAVAETGVDPLLGLGPQNLSAAAAVVDAVW